MKIELDDLEFKDFLKWRLSTEMKSTQDNGRTPGNALNDSDDGAIAALNDAISIFPISEKKTYHSMMKSVWKTRLKSKSPHYDPSQDKCNSDSWWISGYERIMKMLLIGKSDRQS